MTLIPIDKNNKIFTMMILVILGINHHDFVLGTNPKDLTPLKIIVHAMITLFSNQHEILFVLPNILPLI